MRKIGVSLWLAIAVILMGVLLAVSQPSTLAQSGTATPTPEIHETDRCREERMTTEAHHMTCPGELIVLPENFPLEANLYLYGIVRITVSGNTVTAVDEDGLLSDNATLVRVYPINWSRTDAVISFGGGEIGTLIYLNEGSEFPIGSFVKFFAGDNLSIYALTDEPTNNAITWLGYGWGEVEGTLPFTSRPMPNGYFVCNQCQDYLESLAHPQAAEDQWKYVSEGNWVREPGEADEPIYTFWYDEEEEEMHIFNSEYQEVNRFTGEWLTYIEPGGVMQFWFCWGDCNSDNHLEWLEIYYAQPTATPIPTIPPTFTPDPTTLAVTNPGCEYSPDSILLSDTSPRHINTNDYALMWGEPFIYDTDLAEERVYAFFETNDGENWNLYYCYEISAGNWDWRSIPMTDDFLLGFSWERERDILKVGPYGVFGQ